MATYKIAIDTLGSDKGPVTIVQGALMALAENPELSVALFGDEQVIRAYLATVEHDPQRIEIVHPSLNLLVYGDYKFGMC